MIRKLGNVLFHKEVRVKYMKILAQRHDTVQAAPDLVKCAAYVGQHYFYFKFHLVRAVDGARPLSRPLRLLFCLSVSEVKTSASKNFIMTSSPTIVSNYLSRCKHQDIAKALE